MRGLLSVPGYLAPPGRRENSKTSVPVIGGADHSNGDINFIAAASLCNKEDEVVSALASANITSLFQSESEGTLQPVGQIFLTSETANQLYKYPYFVKLDGIDVLSCKYKVNAPAVCPVQVWLGRKPRVPPDASNVIAEPSL
jgi:hypothetical protein